MPTAESKALFVKQNFDTISARYDRFNDWNSFFLHRLWKNRLVKEIEERAGQKILALDLCCGTGDISVRLERSPQVDKVLCVDFSEGMLDIARHRLADPIRKGRVQVQVGDATNLSSIQSSSLDAVSVGFGLRNVDNLDKAISEIYRVLKPGGIFANLDVGKVQYPLVRWLANFYFFRIVPILGHLLWGGKNEMFNYLPVSSLTYPDQNSLKELLQKRGFTDVRYKNFVFGNAVLHTGKK
ncbi:ubiquinone/menaquinone biosynthesis methyltransferase [Leptospira inadai serovar Lyme str. 10]|uniref:Demethylmenaquinone methyltransferase n=2 Tax=Leptospira inadai serovar Lyme TaxID=293084 RepID=V6HAA3_9LEPT|nr:ubiquinone/menaquinone biosynthesis methyltransferase [Leptospira inadai serovar Lyme str. 10]